MEVLALDIGNTRIKWGLLRDDHLVQGGTVQSAHELQHIAQGHPALRGVAVASGPFNLADLPAGIPWHVVNAHSQLPFENGYGTGEGVGPDRLALAAAAVKMYPQRDVLVVALGTCVTYNVITRKGIFLGGAISPGWKMRLDAMHHYTAALPLLEPAEQLAWPATTTRNNMLGGAFLGLLAEVNGFVQRMDEQYPGAVVVFTGGDAEILKKHVKFPIFAPPGFLLTGANSILKLNLSE
jgi:type III pantothenate kinase